MSNESTNDIPEPSPASAGSQPVAWAVESRRRGVWLALHPTQERAEYEARAYDESGTVFPVYRQPTLTDEERESIAAGIGALESLYADAPPVSRPIYDAYVPTLRGLLNRTK